MPIKTLFLIVLLCSVGMSAQAQEDKSDTSSDNNKDTSSQQQASTPDKQPPPGSVKTAESFTPSEEVSEDLSVSFPVDI